MSKGLPGLAGTEHVGFTVPDIEAATRFFVEVIGCEVLFEAGPFHAEDDWMARHLAVHPRAVIAKLRMLRCANGPAFELLEYVAPDQARMPPRNSDVGGWHLAFYVEDMEAALAHLRTAGVEVLGEPTTIGEGPTRGLTWVYFNSPWGQQLELVSFPRGLAYTAAASVRPWDPREG